MELNMNDFLNKGLETMSNISKIGANVTDSAKKDKQPKTETTNQQHQQSVNVLVGETEKKTPMPLIVKEKPETHIHKRFPDNRALTKDECDVETLRMKLEFEEKERDRNFQREMEEKRAKERKEREEFERADRIRREEEQKRARKRRQMVVGGIGLGLVGFAVYSWMRNDRNGNVHQCKLPEPKVTADITVEGAVE